MTTKLKIPKIRFKEFFGEWEEKILSSVYVFVGSNSYSRECLNYKNGIIKNIHYGDIHTKFKTNFKIENEKVPFINDDIDLSKVSEDKFCKEGDLVIADASEDYKDIGKTIELIELNNQKILAGLHTFIARPKKNNISLGFGGYLMKTYKIRIQIMTYAVGIKVLGISKTNLGLVNINLPSLPEQQKIASFLGSIDEKIEIIKEKKKNLEVYKKGVIQKIFSQELRFKDENGKEFGDWEERKFNTILLEHGEKSTGIELVHSVSVHKGIINQIEHLGRVFAAKNTDNYNLVKPGDIIYTKSPTGNFPYGIIKQSHQNENVIVSPLYGVFTPETSALGLILHTYFLSSINTNNYLHSIVQKGAKNTMNITNTTFLSKSLFLPTSKIEQEKIADFLSGIDEKIEKVGEKLRKMEDFKKGLLQGMFV